MSSGSGQIRLGCGSTNTSQRRNDGYAQVPRKILGLIESTFTAP